MLFYTSRVKFWTPKHQRRAGKLAAVSLMLLLWVGTVALVSSPELHRLLHVDSQSPNHHCFISQLGKSSVLPGLPSLASPTPALTWIGLVRLSDLQYFSIFDYRLSPSRAPPSAGLSRFA
jgi:hypothetical protein